MYKNIFVPLQGLACDSDALAAAYNVARRFGSHLDCVHVRTDPRLLIASTTSAMETGLGVSAFSPELWNELVEAEKRRARSARDQFAAATEKFGISKSGDGVTASFRDLEGDPAGELIKSARYCDLVVLRPDTLSSETAFDAQGDLILGCGRPVLLADASSDPGPLSTIAIAWKDTAEAARALTAAMPLLAKASSIVVLSAREGSRKVEDALRSAEHVAALLRRHGLAARAEHVPTDHKTLPEAVVARARDVKADLLVMGAYGHGRVREIVFGGFTRHVLGKDTGLAVLMAH